MPRIETGKSAAGAGSQWSIKYDDFELRAYMEQLGREGEILIAAITIKLAIKAIIKQQQRLHGMGGVSRPAAFSQGKRRTWREMGSRKKAESKIADSLKWRHSKSGTEHRVSVFSDPFPGGVEGSRGGKIARYYEEGTGSFFTGRNRSGGGGFTHRGFPALKYMEQIGLDISEGFIDEFLREAKKLAPNGMGGGSIPTGGA